MTFTLYYLVSKNDTDEQARQRAIEKLSYRLAGGQSIKLYTKEHSAKNELQRYPNVYRAYKKLVLQVVEDLE